MSNNFYECCSWVGISEQNIQVTTSHGSLNSLWDYLTYENQDIGCAKRLKQVTEFVLNEFKSVLF